MLLFVLLWTECLCPSAPRSYVEILMPNVMVLGGAGFEGCLSLKCDSVLLNVCVPLPDVGLSTDGTKSGLREL